MKKALIILSAMLALVSCSRGKGDGLTYGVEPIYPDYMNVTVPPTIAPLNFSYTVDTRKTPVTVFSVGEENVKIRGREVEWREGKWKKFLESAAGDTIRVSCAALDTAWTIMVSADSVDYGLDYRLAAPGYEVTSRMGLYERKLSSFRERTLFTNARFNGRITALGLNHCSPTSFSMHISGKNGVTLSKKGRRLTAFQAGSTKGTYGNPYWHPTGNYIAYSVNNLHKAYHVNPDKVQEYYDSNSDIVVYDVVNDKLTKLGQDYLLETSPAFAPDGKTLYFCAAENGMEYERYNLYKVSFDPETGSIGNDVQTVLNADRQRKSISNPRPSFDGKYILYTLTDYGSVAEWHREADLWVLELATGKSRPVDEINSTDTDCFGNWSSSSCWLVFSSRRDDGLYSRPYICHVNEDGTFDKPFMLPQQGPAQFYAAQMDSYEDPQFVTGQVRFGRILAQRLINSDERERFGFRVKEEEN